MLALNCKFDLPLVYLTAAMVGDVVLVEVFYTVRSGHILPV